MNPYDSADEVLDPKFGSINWHNPFGEQFGNSNKRS